MTRALPIAMSSLLLLAACDRDSDSPFSPSSIASLTLENVAASASVGDTQGVRQDGPVPLSGSGPVVTISGNQTVVNGGTMVVTVTAALPFQTIYVYVAATAFGLAAETNVGIGGFYEIRLPSPRTSASVLLTFPQTISLEEFELQFAGADAAGKVGPFVGHPTTVTQVGTGDVQVTLSWDADSDVDIHVVEPGGRETYYGSRESPTGGRLDLDSNAACEIDGVRNENITWPVGRAPRGVYTVRVDYWSNCGVAQTNYTVRINNGGSIGIFSGSFTGPGDAGGQGSGRTITTFERLTGPAAVSTSLSVPEPARVSKPGISTSAPK